jgi:single-strand DNA-binding protein
MNFVMLKGHVGQEPTIRTLDNGRKVSQFTLATTARYKAEDGSWKEEPSVWHNIVAWGYLSEKPITKGNLVQVIGKISNRSYDDKDGVKRYHSEVVATDLDIIKVMSKAPQAPPPPDPLERRNVDAQGFTTPATTTNATVDPSFFNSDIGPNTSEPIPF